MKFSGQRMLGLIAFSFLSACGKSGNDSHEPPAGITSAKAAIVFLSRLMDQYHDRFPIYDDVSSGGNHFHSYGKIPDQDASVEMNGSWPIEPHSGATAIRCEFAGSAGPSFGGFYLLNGVLPAGATSPQVNFGAIPDAGITALSGAAENLTFWVRGERGGEQIDFFVAGVGRDARSGIPIQPYPDSSPRHPPFGSLFVLTTQWQRFTIDVSGLDLAYVLGGFGWAASSKHNPEGAVFYLDDIQYNLTSAAIAERLDEPRFIQSYQTLPVQPDPFDQNTDDDIDLTLRNVAFAYDNALALLAYLADGTAQSVRRAKLVGDAFVYATHHDRTFTDGRIRSAYSAGDLALPPGWTPNEHVGTVPIPGFYYENQPTPAFYEVEQTASDVGNNAWAMIALLALHRVTGEQSYLDTARRIGEFIQTFRNTSGTYQGFTGGSTDPEGSATRRPWASVEHNLDVYAAFQVMFTLTGEASWSIDAQHAQQFVEAMWDRDGGCYLAGTIDPEMLNTTQGQRPLDVQAWSVLALSTTLRLHRDVLECAETHHFITHAGFAGYDFNDDRDCVWFEGTGQMAVAYAVTRNVPRVIALRAVLAAAQVTPRFGDGFGLAASSCNGQTTGFGFKYFTRLHVGATAWNVFAQLGINPYYRSSD